MEIWQSQKGFTLTELLVAMGLSIAVLAAANAVFRVQTHTVKAQEFKMEAQEDARAALDMMVREARNLGFFPTLTACTTAPANTNGIIAAAGNNFRFVYDYRGDNPADPPDGDCDDPGENITYSYNGVDITRDINDGNGPQVLTAQNVSNAVFSYFNGAGAATTNPANIRRVFITLDVRSRSNDVQFGGQQIIRMESNVDLRNRGNG